MLQHLRNYSNYLNPPGRSHFLQLPLLVFLGIVINFLVIFPIIALISVLLAVYVIYNIEDEIPNAGIYLLLILSAWALFYAIVLSLTKTTKYQDIERSIWLRLTLYLTYAVLIAEFILIQRPILLEINTNEPNDLAKVYYFIAGGIGIFGIVLSFMRNLVQRLATAISRFWRIALGMVAPLLAWVLILTICSTLVYPKSWFEWMSYSSFPEVAINVQQITAPPGVVSGVVNHIDDCWNDIHRRERDIVTHIL